MTAAAYHPDLYFGAAFNADPNDAVAVPVWSDQTAKVAKVGEISRGRQYELAQTVAAMPNILFRDPNEDLNPANTSSPYYPFVQPYRQLLALAQWPNTPVTGNLINSGAWRGNKIDAYDPSFEAYANGAALPSWLTAVGSVAGSITTTNPQQGTKSATYAVAATGTVQGLGWQVPCIPGRQYTSSAYVRQSSASTQRIDVTDQTLVWDGFTPRTAVAGLGTPNFGPAYTLSGTAADFAVNGGYAVITPSASAADRLALVALGSVEQNQVALIGPVPIPASSTTRQGVLARYTDSSNHYAAYAEVDSAGVVSAVIAERAAGVLTALATTATVLPVTVPLMLRFQATGAGTLQMKLWNATQPEPTAWTTTATDTTQTGTGGGLLARHEVTTGIPFYFDLYQAVCAVTGTSTATTGAYVRLSATWTATQPYHTVRLTTVGTAVAGTVNQDSLMHEQAATASTWTAAGSVIYPLMRNYVERWPREWTSEGFEGWCNAPVVDGFAALAAIDLNTEYAAALATTGPDWCWKLNDGTVTGQFLDSSGFSRPPLVRNISKFGAGTDIAPGTSIPVPGDPGATGVLFTATGSAVAWDQVGTSLAAGIGSSLAQISLPPVAVAGWQISAAAWYAATSNGEVQEIFGAFRRADVINRYWWSPFDITMDSTKISLAMHNGATSTNANTSTPGYADGRPHFVVATVTQDATTTTLKLYFDGVLNATTAVANATAGGILAGTASMPMVGGLFDGSNSGRMLRGTVTWASIWNRVLTAAEVTALWNAGGLGNAGETPGARAARDLTRAGYPGATRITTASTTTMQAPSFTGAIDLLTDSQNNAGAEQGTIWMGPDGAYVFESRQDRYLRLTSLYTLGENEAGGEKPYGSNIGFDYDPMFVFPNVTATRPGGATAAGGLAADIMAARRRFFPRPFAIDADVQTDPQIQDLADWIFYTHRAPGQRVGEITFNPVGNPSLWPFVLSVEVGQRVTVVRRAKAANSGAGLTMSEDYFVENVKHNEIDRTTGQWTVTFLLSPIGTGPGITVQPWVLDHPTYGVLGATTVLGL